MKLTTIFTTYNKRSSWRMLCCSMVLCVLALTGGAYAQVGVGVAGTGDPGGFAIEGNLLANNPNVAPYNIASDWTDGPAGLGIGVLNLNGTSKDTNVTKHPIDLTGNDDQDVFKTGSNKVSDNPNSYNWVVGSVPQKDDIGNGYVHFSVDGSGNRWVAVGGDRRAINGDSYIDFEFLQNGLNKNSDGTFTAPGPDSGRTVGDFLLTIELTQGGSAAQFFAQKWLRDSSGGVQLNTFSYHDITGSLPPLTAFVAANIDSAVVVPWGAFGSTTYGINQFGEAVANVTALTNSGNDPCIAFQTVFIRTKSSQSATAELKDFIAPITFHICSDVTPPQITCPTDQTFECSSIGTFNNATATDECTQTVSITEHRDTTAGSCPQNKDIRRIFTATDNCGNSAVCTSFVHIVDTTPPQLTCPAEQTFECSAIGAFGSASATDNCDQSVSISEVRDTSGTCPVNIRRIFTATDDCGNTAKCTSFVHIADTTPPQLTCPAEQTFECSAIGAFGSASATDNCDQSVSISEVRDTSGTCPVNIRRIFTATDDCGNTAKCTSFVHIADTTPPQLTCPAEQTFECNAIGAFGSASATDNCDQSVSISEVRDTSGTCPVNIRRIFTATDDCGNSAKCTTFVHIADTQAPTLTCHADTTIACNTTPVFTPPTASDNCDATPTVNLTADYSLAGQNGATIFVRTWTATDDCGNVSDSCSQHITVETCPGDTFCTLTQGAYGNAGGKWNGIGRLQLIQTLIGNNPLVIGKPGRSLTFSAGDASCIILRLPAGGPPATFPSTLGDATMHPTDCQTSPTPLPLKNDKFRNVFLGQLITISLNVRLDTDLGALQLCSVMNTSGGQILIPGPVLSSLTSLGLPQTVDGLIELANRAIAGQATGTATVNQISSALDAINTGFDECKAFLGCGQAVQGSLNRGNVEGTDGTINSVPTVFALHENYPNPFNPTTKINYDLPEQSTVRISVFNILGQEVATLVNGVVDAGYQSVEWNATSNNMTVLPSGLYMYRIQVTSLVSGSEFSQVRKMLLMK